MTKPLMKAHDATISAWEETVVAIRWIVPFSLGVGLMAHLIGLAAISMSGVL